MRLKKPFPIWRTIELYFLKESGTLEQCAEATELAPADVEAAFKKRLPTWRLYFAVSQDEATKVIHFVPNEKWMRLFPPEKLKGSPYEFLIFHRKRIAVLVADQYQELEVWYPLLRFREDGAETIAVGKEAGKEYLSKKGYPVVANRSSAEVTADDFDAVIIPGGWAPDILRQDQHMVRLAREMHKAGKVVAAICHGGWLLASAEIVKGRRVTCFVAIKDDLIHAGAEYVDEEVVVDRNLITSRKPDDLPAFCREIHNALVAHPVAARRAGRASVGNT
jgi:protease I